MMTKMMTAMKTHKRRRNLLLMGILDRSSGVNVTFATSLDTKPMNAPQRIIKMKEEAKN